MLRISFTAFGIFTAIYFLVAIATRDAGDTPSLAIDPTVPPVFGTYVPVPLPTPPPRRPDFTFTPIPPPFEFPLLPKPCVFVDGNAADAVVAPLGPMACALTDGDYAKAAGPNDARSRGNFAALAAVAPGGDFHATVDATRSENATTLRVDTTISASIKDTTVGCRRVAFVLAGNATAGYRISSIGPPRVTRCG